MGDVADALDPVEFATRLLELLDTTQTTTSYKFATLIALIDEATETLAPGTSTEVVLSGRKIGKRVVQLYWPHAEPFGADGDGNPAVLSQSSQNDVPAKLAKFRSEHGLRSREPIIDAEGVGTAWTDLERDLVSTIIRYPITLLQKFGDGASAVEDRFIYDFAWPGQVGNRQIELDNFDDSVRLRPGVAEMLVRLEPLLRPAIQMKWADFVAGKNRDQVDSKRLDEFLFGAERIDLSRVYEPLLELQRGKCFYCTSRVNNRGHVDHFVPWTRHPTNVLSNLVVAHTTCNLKKRAALASLEHLDNWLGRVAEGESSRMALAQIATDVGWHDDIARSIAVAQGRYLWLPPNAWLWQTGDEFVPFDEQRCRGLFALATSTR